MFGALLLLIVPHSDTLTIRCETQEVNYVWNMSCDPPACGIQQVIFRDRGEIRDWRMLNKTGLPAYDWQRGEWRTTWIEGGVTVEVASPVMVETWTEFDAELIEREWLPECKRARINR